MQRQTAAKFRCNARTQVCGLDLGLLNAVRRTTSLRLAALQPRGIQLWKAAAARRQTPGGGLVWALWSQAGSAPSKLSAGCPHLCPLIRFGEHQPPDLRPTQLHGRVLLLSHAVPSLRFQSQGRDERKDEGPGGVVHSRLSPGWFGDALH